MQPHTDKCRTIWRFHRTAGKLTTKHICERAGDIEIESPSATEELKKIRNLLAKHLCAMGFYPSFHRAQNAISVAIRFFKSGYDEFEDHVY